MKWLWILFFSFLSTNAYAGMYGELTTFYSTDSFTTASNASKANSVYSLDLYANLESKARYFGGFHVEQVALQETNSTGTISLSSMNMGPMLLWVMDRRKVFTLSAGYNIVAKGAYNDGTTSSELSGTGLFASFAAMPEVAENWYVGVKLSYLSLNYNKSVVDGTSSDVSYTRALIYPAICISYRD